MSAIIVDVQQDAIYFAADGVAYGPDGAIRGMTAKIQILPHLECFIGNTGVSGVAAAIQIAMAENIRDFDHLLENLPALFRHAVEQIAIAFGASGVSKSCVVVGGYSRQRSAFEAYRLMSYAKESLGGHGSTVTIEPWTLSAIPATWCNVAPTQTAIEACGVMADGIDPIQYCARVVSACRQKSGSDEDGEYFNCGGFLQVGVLERNRIDSWIAHRWAEDEVGKPVDPTTGALSPI